MPFADKDELARVVAENGYQRVVAMRDADSWAAADGADASERLRAQAKAFTHPT
ncbi:hypothetical protein ACGFZQ_26855 [Streptomyces sp. NPDC048254]|uniref:hypothetical protein n=1 Tax=Streptomyces sp. NPDC048254 TaxID=3365525 RepID=UPI0037100D63